MNRVKTEYAELMAEQAKVERKLSAQGRAFSRWFPAKPEPEPDPYVWHSVEELIEGRS